MLLKKKNLLPCLCSLQPFPLPTIGPMDSSAVTLDLATAAKTLVAIIPPKDSSKRVERDGSRQTLSKYSCVIFVDKIYAVMVGKDTYCC